LVEKMAREDTFTLGLADMNLDKVARVLRSAARIQGDVGSFVMGFRTMGKCAGLSPTAAHEIARKLLALGHLVVVEKGTVGRRGKATVWRWIGP
jgi:hypothetical protein